MTTVQVQAPAKLNLGLEILGRRADGYHEIRTVLAMVDCLDTLTVDATPDATIVRTADIPGISEEDDLALRALKRLHGAAQTSLGATLTLDKRIPTGAGLGGASSDAAAALLAGRHVWRMELDDQELREIAGTLGADVPFFLDGPCSLAHGIGTTLEPLPPLHGWAVIASPLLSLERKTATLYSLIHASDFSDGSEVYAVASSIRQGDLPAAETLTNAFLRPLLRLVPTLAELAPAMRRAGAPFVALSGAGGSHYTLLRESAHAHYLASQLRDSLPTTVQLTVASLRDGGLLVEEQSTS